MTSPKPWKQITRRFFLLGHASSSSPCPEKAAHSIDFLVVAESRILPEIMAVKVKATTFLPLGNSVKARAEIRTLSYAKSQARRPTRPNLETGWFYLGQGAFNNMNVAPTGVINDAGSQNPRTTPLARSPKIQTAPLFSTNPQWGTPRSHTDLRSVGNLLPSDATFKVWDDTSGRATNGGSVWQALVRPRARLPDLSLLYNRSIEQLDAEPLARYARFPVITGTCGIIVTALNALPLPDSMENERYRLMLADVRVGFVQGAYFNFCVSARLLLLLQDVVTNDSKLTDSEQCLHPLTRHRLLAFSEGDLGMQSLPPPVAIPSCSRHETSTDARIVPGHRGYEGAAPGNVSVTVTSTLCSSDVGEREAPPVSFRIDILSGFNQVSSEYNREVNAPPPSAASVIEGSDEDKVLSQYQHLKEEWEDTRNPQNEAKNPWKTCLDHLVKRDKTKCNAWGEDVDTILIFIVGGFVFRGGHAFTIHSYKWLEADPGDTTNMILQHLSGQLAGTQRLEYVPALFTITSSVRRIDGKED
ncbi:hypothetical protein CPB85DRAFT_1260996 [Mucidula mucida]|nr:hypothetical protein CPB85DRAFT_1260996 [Mucidula mucida]